MSTQNGSYDLIVIGAGQGGGPLAGAAATAGLRVAVIERKHVGGTCVNTGCVPSKALLATAEARHVTLDASRFPGLPLPEVRPVDMPALIAGKDRLVGSLRGEKYLDLATEYGWDLHPGDATFVGTPSEPALRVTGPDGTVETVRAAHYLIATGSRPWAPPVPGLQEAGYLTSTTAMELDHVPESLLVIGGGYVAETAWGDALFTLDRTTIAWGIIVYGFVAAVLPVWLLLAPRDYLSTFMKIGTIVLLAVAIVIVRPELAVPAVSEFAGRSDGPVVSGPLFPFLFVTIA